VDSRIIIASDHRGYWLKDHLKQYDAIGTTYISWYDVGPFTPERSDYTEYGIHACNEFRDDKGDCLILICGTGTGMAIVANRYRYLYAGVAWTPEIARHGKEDDNMNVLALPADWIDQNQAHDIINAWLESHFKRGRYAQRVSMIDTI